MLPSNDRNITHVITWKHLKHGQGVEYRYSYTMTYCFSPRIGFDNWFWDEQEFHPTYLVGQELEVVKSPKCLAFIVTSNFTWNAHVNNVVANTMKRLFPCTGKALSQKKLVLFQLFYTISKVSFLTQYQIVSKQRQTSHLQCELERGQKKAFSISLGVV